MIAKGNTHRNGKKLARYMMTGKEGERALLWQLSGFAAGDIREAFGSVHVMADATHCEQPFFHLQVRNPQGEELSRTEWRRVADRIETKLGLTNQPRAIVFHIDENTGHEHMHVAWSRIDAESLTATPLPFFKVKLKEVCRQLEKQLDLTRVKSERDGPVMAPNRNEFEEARRLGVDIHAVRNTIRDCFERSDNGRSFEAALADHGFVLAQGDRRAFVVIDHEGGIHALGKRILGLTAGQTRDRLADLDRDQLPGVEQARSFIREQQVSREKTRPKPMRDPHREEIAWQDALAKAAIDKEKIERRFVERQPEREARKSRGQELVAPFQPRTIPLRQAEIDSRPTARQLLSLGNEFSPPKAFGKTAERAVGKTLDAIGNALESLLAPVLTPEQKRAGAQRQAERSADAAYKIDLSQYQADRELARQQRERELEAARQRQRDDRER